MAKWCRVALMEQTLTQTHTQPTLIFTAGEYRVSNQPNHIYLGLYEAENCRKPLHKQCINQSNLKISNLKAH